MDLNRPEQTRPAQNPRDILEGELMGQGDGRNVGGGEKELAVSLRARASTPGGLVVLVFEMGGHMLEERSRPQFWTHEVGDVLSYQFSYLLNHRH